MSEWIQWKGGECPVNPDTRVDVRYEDGVEEFKIAACVFSEPAGNQPDDWWKGEGLPGENITAYRISD